MSFERTGISADPIQPDDDVASTETEEGTERVLTQEEIFRNIINQELFDSFYDVLDDAHFTDEQLDEFKAAIRALPTDRISGVLSVPFELRPRRVAKFKQAIDAGTLTPTEAIGILDQEAQENGYKLGYHVSPTSIKQDIGREGARQWVVRGYDPDDRDNGRPMAYYALDYDNIFRKRPDTKYLYAVRAHIGDATSHQLDTSNNWGRASSLAVIQEFDIKELEEEVQEEYLRELRAYRAKQETTEE